MANEELLSSAEAAHLVGVTRQTIERWHRDHGLPAFVEVHGKRKIYRFRRSDLVAFVRAWIDGGWH